MQDYVNFPMGEFMTNAGLVGFIKALKLIDPDQDHYQILEEELVVERKFLLEIDLTQLYFDTLINQFQDRSNYTNGYYFVTKLVKKTDLDEKEIKDIVTKLKSYFNNNRYKTAYEVLSKLKTYDYDFTEQIKTWTSKITLEALKLELEKLALFLEEPEVKETFLMKDITYSVINRFWDGKSFLNRNNVKKDMKEVHRQELEEPFKEYLRNDRKVHDYCVECGSPLSNQEKTAFTFMLDSGDDFKRKTSSFWNLKVNNFICPKCAFIYTFVPLGFESLGRDFIFANNNENLLSLTSLNDKKHEILQLELDEKEEAKELTSFEEFNMFLSEMIDKEDLRIRNIQIVRKYFLDGHYNIRMFSKTVIERLQICKSILDKMVMMKSVVIRKEYRNLYQEVVENIIQNNDNQNLFFEIYKESLKKDQEYLRYYLFPIGDIVIRLRQNQRKEKITKMKEKEYYYMTLHGKNIRELLLSASKDDNSLIGLSYKLVNLLEEDDIQGFIRVVVRLCNSVRITIPTDIIKMIESKEKAQDLGLAFIIGLRGGLYEKEEKKDEK